MVPHRPKWETALSQRLEAGNPLRVAASKAAATLGTEALEGQNHAPTTSGRVDGPKRAAFY